VDALLFDEVAGEGNLGGHSEGRKDKGRACSADLEVR
jgi:hypothetical protein